MLPGKRSQEGPPRGRIAGEGQRRPALGGGPFRKPAAHQHQANITTLLSGGEHIQHPRRLIAAEPVHMHNDHRPMAPGERRGQELEPMGERG